jgi:hypothetical protein
MITALQSPDEIEALETKCSNLRISHQYRLHQSYQKIPWVACTKAMLEMEVYITRRKQETLRVAYLQGIISKLFFFFNRTHFIRVSKKEPGHMETFGTSVRT